MKLLFGSRRESAMPGRKLFLVTTFGAIALATGLTALGSIVKHEPNFYHQTQLAAGEGRKRLALEGLSSFTQMVGDKNAKKADWGSVVSEAQLNSFFAEIFTEKGESEGLRKLGISSPSVVLEQENHLRIAFRYDTGWFSTIISYDLKVWLVQKDPNVIAVEFQSARAGALPISSQAILQQLCEYGRKLDYKVNLFRHEGNSVAVIQLQPNEIHPTWILTALQVKDNKLSIRGKTLEHALPPPLLKTPQAPG
jgi:hypothetical protein